MLYLNNSNKRTILRKELRLAFAEIDNVSMYNLRHNIIDLLESGEHKITTVVPFIKSLVSETLESLTIEDLVKTNESQIGLHKLKNAMETYLINFAMHVCKKQK